MFYSINKLKRAAVLSVVTLLFAGTVLGQGFRRMSPEEAKEAFDTNFVELVSTLELTDDLAPQVKEVLWAQQEKMQELRASVQGGGGNQLARSGIREKMGTINEETLAALSELLSEDQLEEYAEIQATRRGGRGQGRGQGQQRRPPQ